MKIFYSLHLTTVPSITLVSSFNISAMCLEAPKIPLPCRESERRRVKWPATNKEWLKLDEDVDKIPEAT